MPSFDNNLITRAVAFRQLDAHALRPRRRDVLAHKIRADRKLPVAAIDQNRQLDARRPAKVHQRVERGADRPAREKHVIHEDHGLVGDIKIYACFANDRLVGNERQVVPVKVDVENAAGDRFLFDGLDGQFEAVGKDNPAGADADQADILNALVALEDLVGDAGDRAPDLLRVHDLGNGGHRPPINPTFARFSK